MQLGQVVVIARGVAEPHGPRGFRDQKRLRIVRFGLGEQVTHRGAVCVLRLSAQHASDGVVREGEPKRRALARR